MSDHGGNIDELLAEARRHIYLPSELDVAGRVAAANLAYGMARLLAAVRAVAPGGRVTYTASPDFTITRTIKRWQGGFAYGGVFDFELEGLDLAFPELRPNACGTLVGRLAKPTTAGEIIRRASRLRSESKDPVWDYSRRNHFINLYRSRTGGEQLFIIHGCPARIRFDSDDGPGLDTNKSTFWQPRCEPVATPLGETGVLTGADARLYWANYRRCEALSMGDRLRTAERIFGAFETVRNVSHAGMASPLSYFQGCHVGCRPGALYPVLTRPGAPAFLVTAAGDSGRSPLLPHGTGYHLDLPEPLTVIEDASGRRPVFVLGEAGGAQQAYGDFSSVPFSYREASLVETWKCRGQLAIRETLDMVATVKL